MNIIEKLGITPGPWVYNRFGDKFGGIEIEGDGIYRAPTLHIDHNDARLIATAPEMLEALIRSAKILEHIDLIKIIEKATSKTWEEVKELVEDKA